MPFSKVTELADGLRMFRARRVPRLGVAAEISNRNRTRSVASLGRLVPWGAGSGLIDLQQLEVAEAQMPVAGIRHIEREIAEGACDEGERRDLGDRDEARLQRHGPFRGSL